MRFVALVSGGKDSVFSIGKALAHGHELVCLANLYPPDTGPEELDSFMFQSAGAAAIECLAECLGVPLLRAPLRGGSGHQGLHYAVMEGDEVEDLFDLIRHVKVRFGVGGLWVLGWGVNRILLGGVEASQAPLNSTTPPPPHQNQKGDLPRCGGRGQRGCPLHLPADPCRERLRPAGAPVAGLSVAGPSFYPFVPRGPCLSRLDHLIG